MAFLPRLSVFARFLKNTKANVAFSFAGGALALAGVAALSVEYSRLTGAKEQLQAAVDQTLLAYATRDASDTTSKAAFLHRKLTAAMGSGVLAQSTLQQANWPETATEMAAVVTARVPLGFGGLLGVDSVDVTVNSAVRLPGAAGGGGAAAGSEIALVIDTTGSMAGARIAAAKAAAKTLVDTLAPAGAGSMVKFSVVPFSTQVNVGLNQRGKPWLRLDETSTNVPAGQICTCPAYSWGACTPSPTESDPNHQTCSYTCIGPETCTPTSAYTIENKFNGCVYNRSIGADRRDFDYATGGESYVVAVKAPVVPGYSVMPCSSPQIVPLTTNVASVKTAIDALTTDGETYIPAGLLWGWYSLSTREPFGEGVEGAKKSLVLMTDGANTRSNQWDYWSGAFASTGTDVIIANQTTAAICENAKADGVQIYTIALAVTDPTIKNILRACAEPTGQFFDAPSASDLAAAFSQVGAAISQAKVRLVR